jgi:hypothetical protein
MNTTLLNDLLAQALTQALADTLKPILEEATNKAMAEAKATPSDNKDMADLIVLVAILEGRINELESKLDQVEIDTDLDSKVEEAIQNVISDEIETALNNGSFEISFRG